MTARVSHPTSPYLTYNDASLSNRQALGPRFKYRSPAFFVNQRMARSGPLRTLATCILGFSKQATADNAPHSIKDDCTTATPKMFRPAYPKEEIISTLLHTRRKLYDKQPKR